MGLRRALLLLQTLLAVQVACSPAPSTPEECYRLVVRARALLEAGDSKSAEGLLKSVAEADPEADAYANLAWVQWSRGQHKDALRSWETALELDPAHPRALYSMAAVRLRELNESGATPQTDPEAWAAVRGLAERASQAGAQSASIQRLLCTVCRAMGDPTTAAVAQKEAERLDPGRGGTAAVIDGLEGIRLPRVRQASPRVRTPPHFVVKRDGQRATSLFPVDLDGNGQRDLVLGGTSFIAWAERDAESSRMEWQISPFLEDPLLLACASLFDADGLQDLVAFTQAADSLTQPLQREDARRSTTPRPQVEDAHRSTTPRPQVGDAHRSRRQRDTRVWLVRGGSRRPQTRWLYNLSVPVLDAQAVDVDWDGDQDVVIAVPEAPGLRLLRNEGNGAFAEAAAVPGCAEFGPARKVVVSDVDGDGRDDLITLDAYWRVRVFASRATGVFADLSVRSGLATQRARVVVAADLNEDGLRDLLLGDDEGLWIWANEGSGRFVRAAAYRDALGDWVARARRGIPVASVHLADLDNDGLLDVVTQHFASPPPVFATLSEATEGTEDTAPGTRRLEPLLDVPAWTRLAVWHNEDNMLFADVTAASGCSETLVGAAALASGDFNGDGAVDLVAAGADSSLLFLWSQGGTVHRRLKLELVDPARPAAAVGARVELHWGTHAAHRTLRAPVVSMGVLDAEIADVLRVQWPDGTVENYFHVPLPSSDALRLRRQR